MPLRLLVPNGVVEVLNLYYHYHSLQRPNLFPLFYQLCHRGLLIGFWTTLFPTMQVVSNVLTQGQILDETLAHIRPIFI